MSKNTTIGRPIGTLQRTKNEKKNLTLKSFYTTDESGTDEESNGMLRVLSNLSLAPDYEIDDNGIPTLPSAITSNDIGKSFRKKIKRIARKEKRIGSTAIDSDDDVEVPRGAPSRTTTNINANKKKKTTTLSQLVLSSTKDAIVPYGNTIPLNGLQSDLRVARMKIFAARTALEVEPKVMERVKQRMELDKKGIEKVKMQSPGVFSLHASQILESNRADQELAQSARGLIAEPISDDRMRALVAECRHNSELNEQLLYTTKYDNKWKNKYTDLFILEEGGRKKKKPDNRQGWVLPLKKICDKVGISSTFFTNDRSINLSDARAHVLYLRLTHCVEVGEWLSQFDPESVKNPSLNSFLSSQLDPRAMLTRLGLFNKHISADRDRVRVAGQYYNNIQLGKRMFGPAKKAKFSRTIVGGMERRFEILDNQVNHVPFTHKSSDANIEKCRNIRVKCNDSSRVVLYFDSMNSELDMTSSSSDSSFIHANRVQDGPLFNQFIITQAPMENTIGDFWRMVWQENCPYIFMLISRKDKKRCAQYWPLSNQSPSIQYGSLRIENMGVSTSRDALFRVSYIRIIGPNGREHHVEHWQGDMNNSANVESSLRVLALSRGCSSPVIIHDCLGISRAACLIAAEIAICNLIKGPTYKHPIQQSVHYLRRARPFSIETPMQYIFVHRLVSHFFRPISGAPKGFDSDYKRWISERAERMFVDPLDAAVPGYRLLSPLVDPDLLKQARRPERPNDKREAPDCVGEWPSRMMDNDILSSARRKISI